MASPSSNCYCAHCPMLSVLLPSFSLGDPMRKPRLGEDKKLVQLRPHFGRFEWEAERAHWNPGRGPRGKESQDPSVGGTEGPGNS